MPDNGKDLIHKLNNFVSPVSLASSSKHIPVSSCVFRGNERKYLLDCLDRGWLTQGKYVHKLEEQFADYIGSKHAIACSSGTSALHLAYLALGVNKDTTVITSPLTYIATANAAKYCGAKVLFPDIDRDSWCLNINPVPADFPRTIFAPVHIYDSTAEVPAWCTTLEDSCHALGAQAYFGLRDYKVGTLGDIGTFSLFSSKNIGCGEGGMVVTDNDELASKIKLYRGQGAPTPGIYYHFIIGYNYRMTEMQGAIALAQLEQLDRFIQYRREVINRYRSNFSNHSSFITLQGGKRSAGWMMAVLFQSEEIKNKVARSLSSYNIETRPFFIPLPLLPPYSDCGPCPPIAKDIYSRGLCLPTHCELEMEDVDKISEIVINSAKKNTQRDKGNG